MVTIKARVEVRRDSFACNVYVRHGAPCLSIRMVVTFVQYIGTAIPGVEDDYLTVRRRRDEQYTGLRSWQQSLHRPTLLFMKNDSYINRTIEASRIAHLTRERQACSWCDPRANRRGGKLSGSRSPFLVRSYCRFFGRGRCHG